MTAAVVTSALGVFAIGAIAHHRVVAQRSIAPPAAASTGARSHRDFARRSTTVGAIVSVAVVVFVAGPLAAGIGVAAVVAARRLGPIRHAAKRRAQIERDLPTAMDLLVLSVRAGLSPHQAIGELAAAVPGPVGEAFAEVMRRTQRGQPFADALAALPDLLGGRAGGLADVIATSDRHGLPLGPTLDLLAVEAAAARQRLDQADARRLPVRLSFPLVACTLPSFVLLAIVPAMIAALSSLSGPAW